MWRAEPPSRCRARRCMTRPASLGCSRLEALRRAVSSGARAHGAAGATLVMLETLNDTAPASTSASTTLTVAIYSTWLIPERTSAARHRSHWRHWLPSRCCSGSNGRCATVAASPSPAVRRGCRHHDGSGAGAVRLPPAVARLAVLLGFALPAAILIRSAWAADCAPRVWPMISGARSGQTVFVAGTSTLVILGTSRSSWAGEALHAPLAHRRGHAAERAGLCG